MANKKISLLALLIDALYGNSLNGMERIQELVVSLGSIQENHLILPSFYLTNDEQHLYGNELHKPQEFYSYPKAKKTIFHEKRYMEKIEQIFSNNIVIATTKRIDRKGIECYTQRIALEQTRFEYDSPSKKTLNEGIPRKHHHLTPDFHRVETDDQTCRLSFFNDKTHFYSYPQPGNSAINQLLYQKVFFSTLKINTGIAHDMKLDDRLIIEPYISRMLAEIFCMTYDLAILQRQKKLIPFIYD